MLAREPKPGAVKTRLGSALGDSAAAALYRAFTEDLCAALSRRFRLTLACTPDPRSTYFAELRRRYKVALVPQGAGDLGARLRRVAAVALGSASRIVLIGSDAPTLSPARITEAFRSLRTRRVVLGPSLDGGYYLLGLRGPLPPIFERVQWGTNRVLARTLARLRNARVAHAVLPCWYDVDVEADLMLLERHLAVLAALGTRPCPHTQRVLRRLALTPPARAAHSRSAKR